VTNSNDHRDEIVRRRGIEERTSEITETKSEKTKKLRFIFEVSIEVYLKDEEEASTSLFSFFRFESPVSTGIFREPPRFSF
jgi:hypothetical protein